MSKTLKIPSAEGPSFDAYLAMPDHGPAPAVIIVPSFFGVNEGLRSTIDGFAARGFIVIAPDPFWRTLPGPLGPEGRAAAIQRMKDYKYDEGISDLRATIGALKSLPEYNGKFALLGYCFGGPLALMGLTRLGADAGVAFHGTGMQAYLDEFDLVSKPFSFHFGEDDPVVPLDQVELIRAALAGKDGEIYVYDGAKHGFAQIEGSNWDPVAGPLAEDRAFAVLERLKTTAAR